MPVGKKVLNYLDLCSYQFQKIMDGYSNLVNLTDVALTLVSLATQILENGIIDNIGLYEITDFERLTY